jgi:hypothetical protein
MNLNKQPNFGFGRALELLEEGSNVQREHWTKGSYLYFIRGHNDLVSPTCFIEPCINMFTVQSTVQPGWLPSQEDLLAKDWMEA